MYGLAEKLFYTLSAVVLGSAFFVVSPTHNSDTAFFQTQVRGEFAKASVQLLGDEPMFTEVPLVISAVNDFYAKSADAMIALLTPAPSEQDAAAIAISTYNNLRVALRPVAPIEPQVSAAVQETQITIPQNFMQEDPVLNIIPPSITFEDPMTTTTVASDSPAVNDSGFPWVNLRDINTGQIYCVAIYNTEVNRYLGPCKNDYR
jgi:hypothetical protein